MLEGEVDSSPRNSLRYWVASYKRICCNRALLDNRLYILDFDLLCRNPAQQIDKLNQFLGLDVNVDDLEAAASTIVIPDSTGRYRDQDCRQLCSEDVEFVRRLGFDVPEKY